MRHHVLPSARLTSKAYLLQDSDGEKSDDLVVDVSNEVSRTACNSEWHIDTYPDAAAA